jgi:prepilin-type N-terminal cleavage/methylation domain-containing protein
MELRPAEGVVTRGTRPGSYRWDNGRFRRPFLRCGCRIEARTGFSLVELLVVVAVVMLMAALLYSTLPSFLNSAGRRGAANVLLNTLEHARIAALESGQNVYVGFADRDFPVGDMRYASFIVFRETSDDERASGAGNYIVLKQWTKLPKNVAFKRIAGSLVPDSGGQTFPGLNAVLPAGRHDETFPSLAFNSSGAVDGSSNPIQLFLYEGYYADEQDVQTRRGSDVFEKISLFRYTGRAQLDVTATNVQ